MLGGADQKALFDYWHDRVRLTNLNRLGAREHVTTQELRHECTNYDELRRLKAVQELDELERCRVIAIIKYECTAGGTSWFEKYKPLPPNGEVVTVLVALRTAI